MFDVIVNGVKICQLEQNYQRNSITIRVNIPMKRLPLELTFNLKFVTRRYEFWQSKPNITSFISHNSIQYRTGRALESCLHIRIEFLGSLCWCGQRAYSITYTTILGICCQRSMLLKMWWHQEYQFICTLFVDITSIFRFQIDYIVYF